MGKEINSWPTLNLGIANKSLQISASNCVFKSFRFMRVVKLKGVVAVLVVDEVAINLVMTKIASQTSYMELPLFRP